MSQPFVAEIRIVSFGFPPKGWAQCNGQSLPINQNQALFALLGTTFGGNGITTFNLPHFRGRTTIGSGSQSGTPVFTPGQMAGEETHTLLLGEMPLHNHLVNASSSSANQTSPSGNYWANGVAQYSTGPINAPLAGNAISQTGSGQAHENRSPYLVLNFIIAITGIFPSRS